MLVHQFLEKAQARQPDAIALIDGTRTITYRDLNARANGFASALIAAGIARHDRVIIAVENSVDMVAAYLGTLKAGAVAIPLPAGPRSDRLADAVADCQPSAAVIDAATAADARTPALFAGCKAIFVGGRIAPGHRWLPPFQRLADAVNTPDATDPAVRIIDRDLAAIIYTSGSTGTPRGVMLTHRNFVANATSIVKYLSLTSADRVMCVLPFHYVYGLSLLHTHLAVGGSIVIDNRFVFPNVVLRSMQQHQVTGFAGVPSTFALLLHRSDLERTPLPSLRYVTQAGGAMPRAQIVEWRARGPQVPFFVMYGATEAAARLAVLDPDRLQQKLGSIGRAIPNVEIQVVDAEGRPCAAGEVGELVARGANISMGYWNDADETQRRFGPLGYRTGDLGYEDADGFIFLVGRKHDMIKVGANRVGAKEIEDVLHDHDRVHEAAVVAAPNDLLGEVPVAFVSLRGAIDDAERSLRAFCASRLPGYKVPERVVICTELPKLEGAGKIDRPALRAQAATIAAERRQTLTGTES
jgi:amino acid adenylation domain-containing protein